MARVHQLLNNFTAGELSPRLDARVDINRYRNGLKTLQNGIVMPHGGVKKRPGTMHVAEVKSSANAVRLVEFQFSTTQAYVLEFGPLYIRFYRDGGQIQSGGSPVEVTTTYSSSEIDNLSFAQSADTLFIAHTSHPIAKLTRTSHTDWTLTDADIEGGPFRTINTDTTNKLSLSTTGSATITGATQADPVVITATAHGFNEGQSVTITSVTGMTELNTNKYVAKNVTTNTFELYDFDERTIDGTGFTAYVSGGTATASTTVFDTFSPGSKILLYSVDSVFTSDHVGALFRLYEPGQQPHTRIPPFQSSTYYLFSEYSKYTLDSKVYGTMNLSSGGGDWRQYADAPRPDKGVVRVYGGNDAAEYYDAVYLHDTSCILEITAYTSATQVTAKVVGDNHVPESVIVDGTSLWEEGAWSDERGYPSEITFFESRLFAAGGTSEPQKIWGSVSGEFENFADGAEDNDALVYELASNKVDVIQWLSPGKVLAIGTASGEYAASASNRQEALTPSNVRIVKQTPYGVSSDRPLQVANATLFLQRYGVPSNEGRKLREFTYSFDVDSYVAPDLTIISEHITGEGVDNLSYQQSPDSIVWAARADGELAAVTYEREQEVVGWHHHALGGTGVDVESIAVIPGTYGDEVWMAVKRTVDGGTVRYIEYMTRGLLDSDAKQDGVYVDSALQYSGSSTTSITGLDHLEGETVDVLGDGFVQSGLEVSSGAITLTTAVEEATVGLPYTMVMEALDIEAGAQGGTARGQRKRISEIYLELYRSMGGRVGRDSSHMSDILYRTTDDPMGTTPDLKTDLVRIGFDGGWVDSTSIRIEHDDPLPFTVLGIVAEMETSG